MLESLLDPLEALRCHAIGENSGHLGSKLGVFDRRSQKLFAGALIESNRVKLVRANTPPAWKRCADEKVRYQLFPDQSLDIFRSDKIFFCHCQCIGQVRQRAHQIGTATGWRTYSEQHRTLPELFCADHRYFGEVM